MSSVEISSLQADARPAFILDDVQGRASSAFAGRTQRVYRGSCLTTVEDFDVYLSQPVPETQIDKVGNKKL